MRSVFYIQKIRNDIKYKSILVLVSFCFILLSFCSSNKKDASVTLICVDQKGERIPGVTIQPDGATETEGITNSEGKRTFTFEELKGVTNAKIKVSKADNEYWHIDPDIISINNDQGLTYIITLLRRKKISLTADITKNGDPQDDYNNIIVKTMPEEEAPWKFTNQVNTLNTFIDPERVDTLKITAQYGKKKIEEPVYFYFSDKKFDYNETIEFKIDSTIKPRRKKVHKDTLTIVTLDRLHWIITPDTSSYMIGNRENLKITKLKSGTYKNLKIKVLLNGGTNLFNIPLSNLNPGNNYELVCDFRRMRAKLYKEERIPENLERTIKIQAN